MPAAPRITLDRRIPFVDAVFAFIEKRADSSRAVEILRLCTAAHVRMAELKESAGRRK